MQPRGQIVPHQTTNTLPKHVVYAEFDLSAARQFKLPPKMILQACREGTEVAGFKWEPFEKKKPAPKGKKPEFPLPWPEPLTSLGVRHST